MEIPGKDSEAKADRLFAAMSALAENFRVRVTRPIKTGKLRVRSLDNSDTPEEVRDAVGDCRPTDVKVDRARASPNRLFTAWIQCPVAEARKVMDAGSLMVGWVRPPVEVLERRPL
ncbi:uncharacterized protein LOC109861693 [Pseudomyrmex gracilis]|uniref:uncharacterized protein LOC109861693 n=1 Tax=Pseudomyrmex gracilis TaxID=219809 RepID=UPI000994FD2F|nr:uncharacterized protein LOC109861693 [Pseudomyrmex gracilis]